MGHATRCVPIIKALVEAGFEPVLASDGAALEILKEAFPNLMAFELPGYNITYSKSSWNFKLQLLFSVPRIRKTIQKEVALVEKIVEQEQIQGIISDNRFGVHHPLIPSVYITHQLRVLAGVLTRLTTRIHTSYIEKFDTCWVPDTIENPTYSGRLSEYSKIQIPVKHIGILSRLKYKSTVEKYKIAIVLSGPEPQRTLLEEKMLSDFSDALGPTILVRGVLSDQLLKTRFKNLEIVNYANEKALSALLNASNIVISRSGYSTLMDLAVLGKKVFFIPTPGQTEQEYLAKRMQDLKIAPFKSQNEFKFSALKQLDTYEGFIKKEVALELELFSLFHGK